MGNKVIFRLKSTLTTINEGITEENIYEQNISVRFLKQKGQQAVTYDPDLKMHFRDNNALRYIFELEISKIRYILSAHLQKATEFLRRVNFAYDWMQLEVKHSGKISKINNKDELIGNWKRLSEKLKKEYTGNEVVEYLNKITEQMESNKPIWDAIHQYFYFGLIFPNIPSAHRPNWENKRIIELSEYEGEEFEEHIIYKNTENNIHNYIIEGNTIHETNTELIKFEGTLSRKEDSILPEKAEVNVEFKREESVCKWNFRLQRVLI